MSAVFKMQGHKQGKGIRLQYCLGYVVVCSTLSYFYVNAILQFI